MSIYTALIVDDDIENIKLLKIVLARYCPDVKIVGEVTNVQDAIDLFNAQQPQLLYLDVELENNTSFDIIDSIENYDSQIIFVTSFKEYALKAIKYDAVDYVLKPLNISELIAATTRAIYRIKQHQKVEERLEERPVKFVALPAMDKVDVIKVDNIIYCEAEGRYTRFFMQNGDSKISSRNLGEYEKLLVNNFFYRIHHQYLVNIDMIVTIDKAGGNYCELINNISLPIAKRRIEGLSRFLNLK